MAIALLFSITAMAQQPVKQKEVVKQQQPVMLERSQKFIIHSDTLRIDTLSLVENTVKIHSVNGQLISDSTYTINYFQSKLKWVHKPKNDTILITYTVLPYDLSKNFFHKDYGIFNRTDSIMRSGFFYNVQPNRGSVFDLGGVNYNGSFARGISFGNSQDVVVNSSFNLQMQGNLPGGIQLTAALTDNNIPVQPEGNTQQLQDFDKVFIQLKRGKQSLTVGDFELGRPPGYFMNFYRKLEGFSYEGEYAMNNGWKSFIKASAAVAKGKYARNIFDATEGNQGPYHLTGANGETFIIILSGTEKVYINGIEMKRGSDADYVIDYNTGEVTFTPARLITSDLRIQVEFEYSDNSYFRTFASGTQELSNKQWKFTLNEFSEQDSKNQPVQQTLDSTSRRKLASVGDSLQNAFIPSADSTVFNPNQVMYKKTIDPTYGIIYIYSVSPDSAFFSLVFSYVGVNKGHYNIANTSANGRVYQWAPPVNGVLQGSYEPYVLLIAPQKHQMLTGAVEFKPDDKTVISFETALTNQDLNTFSTLDDNNNQGLATYLKFSRQMSLEAVQKDPLTLVVSGNYEFNDKDFTPIDNYRPVEFNRDWNTPATTTSYAFNNANVDLNLKKNGYGFMEYAFGILDEPTFYNGYQNTFNFNYIRGRIVIDSKNSITTTTSSLNQTSFIRPNISVAYLVGKKKKYKIGTTFNAERNKIVSTGTDTLSAASYWWYQYGAFIKNNDTSKINYGLTYNHRKDDFGFNNNFREGSSSDNFTLNSKIKITDNHTLNFIFSYRQLHVQDTLLSHEQEDQSLSGRIEYNVVIKRGFMNLTTLYQVGSGLEQKQDFTYVQVPAGQGVYIYLGDLNHNGVQDLNEFAISAFPDQADYIKVFVPTNQYIKIFTNQLSQSVSIQPRVLWTKSSNALKKFLSRFGNTMALQFDNKLDNLDLAQASNPFQLNVNENELVTNNSLLSNTLSFNRISPVYGIDFSWQQSSNKTLLEDGFQNHGLIQYNLRLRWNLNRKWQYTQDITYNIKTNFSEFFPDQNYYLTSRSTLPKISYQTNNNTRLTASYKFQEGANTYGDVDQKLLDNGIALEFRYGAVSKSVLSAKVSYDRISYDGAADSPVEYAILDGLQNGDNVLINVTYDRKISKVVEMSLSYDGRKTGDAQIVHVGRAQLRALF